MTIYFITFNVLFGIKTYSVILHLKNDNSLFKIHNIYDHHMTLFSAYDLKIAIKRNTKALFRIVDADDLLNDIYSKGWLSSCSYLKIGNMRDRNRKKKVCIEPATFSFSNAETCDLRMAQLR